LKYRRFCKPTCTVCKLSFRTVICNKCANCFDSDVEAGYLSYNECISGGGCCCFFRWVWTNGTIYGCFLYQYRVPSTEYQDQSSIMKDSFPIIYMFHFPISPSYHHKLRRLTQIRNVALSF